MRFGLIGTGYWADVAHAAGIRAHPQAELVGVWGRDPRKAEALAERHGWTPGLFRTYYAAGGVLTVAYLGAGSAWLILPSRARDILAGALAVASAAAVVAVAIAPVDVGALAAAGAHRPPASGALRGHVFVWAIALNSFGTVFLIGGSLLSILKRRRVRQNLWIGGGALAVALATGLSRAGAYSFVYAGELIGLACMYYGFTFAGSAPRPQPAPQPAPRLGPAAPG
jgi:hypothetical protein